MADSNSTPPLNTEELDKWMESLGFRYIEPKYMPSSASWRDGHGLSISNEGAQFFFKQLVPKPSLPPKELEKEIDKALDWHGRAVIEAIHQVFDLGKETVTVRGEILDRHRELARQQLLALYPTGSATDAPVLKKLYDLIDPDAYESIDAQIANYEQLLEVIETEYPKTKCSAHHQVDVGEAERKYTASEVRNAVDRIFVSKTSPEMRRVIQEDLLDELAQLQHRKGKS